MYNIFATEWSNPQNANTAIGNITPTDALRLFLGAYLTDQTDKVINAPQSIDEQNARKYQNSAVNFPFIRFCAVVMMPKSFKGEKYAKPATTATPTMFPRKQTGNCHIFLTPILGMEATMPVNNFISNMTMA